MTKHDAGGEGGSKTPKISMMSFMDGPFSQFLPCPHGIHDTLVLNRLYTPGIHIPMLSNVTLLNVLLFHFPMPY